jgi:hypothetical protein
VDNVIASGRRIHGAHDTHQIYIGKAFKRPAFAG